MADSIEKLNIQPPASIYGSFARYNYKLWYAIAEFVDNSTASFYKHERSLAFIHEDNLVIDIDYNPIEGYLRITDNAFGMEKEDFKRAILLNAKPENSDGRNEFGMGLKTAASWFGKKWSVTSTMYGSPNRYYAEVDIPKLEKEKLNDIDIVTSPVSVKDHGTIVEIRDLNRTIEGGRTIAKIKDVLRSMYRRDLADGKITINWQHEPLQFKPYAILTFKDKEWRQNLDFYFDFDHKIHHVTGFVGILGDPDSGYKKAGFALFRRNRVVIGCEGEYYKPLSIFVEAQSTISHKLFGEIDLEDFDINQAKDGFVWDNGLEDKFLSSLKEQIVEYIRFASKTIKDRENSFDPKDSKQIKETKDLTQTRLNKLSSSMTSNQKDDTEDTRSEAEKEFDEIWVNGSEPEEIVYDETTTEYKVPFGRAEETIKVTWSDAGSSYWYSFDKENSEIKINIAHPFFKPFTSSKEFRNVLNQIVIAILVAERNAEASSQYDGYSFNDDINNNINDILKALVK